MRYDEIRPVHTFFIGNLSVPTGDHPQVFNLIEAAEERMRDFLHDQHRMGRYDYSYYPRAFCPEGSLYAVYVHFSDQDDATAFRIVWDGVKPIQNY